MPTPEDLRMYFAEHADQARRHEEQREKATSLILTISSALTGLIGVYGLLFSAKHYERARMHTEILRQIRAEIDRGPNPARSLAQLTQARRANHYQEFRWPSFRAEGRDHRQAVSWVARQRLNVFWEAVHVLVLFIGVGLLIAIWVTYGLPRDDDVKNVLVVEAPRTGPAGTTTSPGGGH